VQYQVFLSLRARSTPGENRHLRRQISSKRLYALELAAVISGPVKECGPVAVNADENRHLRR